MSDLVIGSSSSVRGGLTRRRLLALALVLIPAARALGSEGQAGCPKTSDGNHVWGPWTDWQASYFKEDGKCVKYEMRARTCRKCSTSETDHKENYVSMSNCEEKPKKKDPDSEQCS